MNNGARSRRRSEKTEDRRPKTARGTGSFFASFAKKVPVPIGKLRIASRESRIVAQPYRSLCLGSGFAVRRCSMAQRGLARFSRCLRKRCLSPPFRRPKTAQPYRSLMLGERLCRSALFDGPKGTGSFFALSAKKVPVPAGEVAARPTDTRERDARVTRGQDARDTMPATRCPRHNKERIPGT